MFNYLQRIQYAKSKSDIIAKADGTFLPREKRKRHEEKGTFLFVPHIWLKKLTAEKLILLLLLLYVVCLYLHMQSVLLLSLLVISSFLYYYLDLEP